MGGRSHTAGIMASTDGVPSTRQNSMTASTAGVREVERLAPSHLRSDSDSTAQEECGSNLIRRSHRESEASYWRPTRHDSMRSQDASEVQSKASRRGSHQAESSAPRLLVSFTDELEEGLDEVCPDVKMGHSTDQKFANKKAKGKRARIGYHTAIHSATSGPMASTSRPAVVIDDDGSTGGAPEADNNSLCRLSIGVHEAVGQRKSMEDRHTVIYSLKPITAAGEAVIDGMERSFVGVYDGHNGAQSAEQLQRRLHGSLAQQPALARFQDATGTESCTQADDPVALAFKESFEVMDKEILDRARAERGRDGSTACTMLRIGKAAYFAHVGDTRAVLCSKGKAERITEDHKPNNARECQRIERIGGRVEFSGCWRVLCQPPGRLLGSGLAVARAFGDLDFKDPLRLVVCEPDVRRIILQRSDEFIVMASDGLWDVMEDQDACDIVRVELENAGVFSKGMIVVAPQHAELVAKSCAKALVRESLERRTLDNVTAAVILLCWGT